MFNAFKGATIYYLLSSTALEWVTIDHFVYIVEVVEFTTGY